MPPSGRHFPTGISCRGWGFVGVLPLVLATFTFHFAVVVGFHHRGDGPQTGAVLALVSTAIWWLGRRLNRGSNSILDARHSMFLIPLQFYAAPLFAAGVLMAIATSMAPP